MRRNVSQISKNSYLKFNNLLAAIIKPLKETEPQPVISTKPIQEKPPQPRCVNCGVELTKSVEYCDECHELSKPTKIDYAMFAIVPTVIILFIYFVFFKRTM